MPILKGTTETFRLKDIYSTFDATTGVVTFMVDKASHQKYKTRSKAAKKGWEKRRGVSDK